MTPSLESFANQVRVWMAKHIPDTGLVMPTPDEARLLQRSLFDAGLAGLTWPGEYGGRGLDSQYQAVFDREARSYGFPRLLSIGLDFVGPTLLIWSDDAQKRRYLPPMLRADEVWCEMFSEPGSGSDLAGLRTIAEPADGGWVVTGDKVWTSGAHFADRALLLARSDRSVAKHQGITAMVVDMHSPGICVRPLPQMNGESNFNQVSLSAVSISRSDVVASPGAGWSVARTTLGFERASIGSGGGTRVNTVRSSDLIEAGQASRRIDHAVVLDCIVQSFIGERVLGMLGERLRGRAGEGGVGILGSLPKLAVAKLNKQTAWMLGDLIGPRKVADSEDPGHLLANRWMRTIVSAPSMSIAGGADEVLKNLLSERHLGLPTEPAAPLGHPADLEATGEHR